MKKSCSYYFDLKRFLGKWLIATNYTLQNNRDLINTSNIMRDRRSINHVNNVDSDRGNSPVHYINNDSIDNGNKKSNNNSKDLGPEKADLHRQIQKTLRITPNTRYYNFLYYL